MQEYFHVEVSALCACRLPESSECPIRDAQKRDGSQIAPKVRKLSGRCKLQTVMHLRSTVTARLQLTEGPQCDPQTIHILTGKIRTNQRSAFSASGPILLNLSTTRSFDLHTIMLTYLSMQLVVAYFLVSSTKLSKIRIVSGIVRRALVATASPREQGISP